MINAIPQYILFVWLGAYPGNAESLSTAIFFDLSQCQYAAQLANARNSVNTAYCVAVQRKER